MSAARRAPRTCAGASCSPSATSMGRLCRWARPPAWRHPRPTSSAISRWRSARAPVTPASPPPGRRWGSTSRAPSKPGKATPRSTPVRRSALLRLGKTEEAKRLYESVAEKRADLPPSLVAAVARFLPGHEAVGVRPATREPIAALALAADGEVAAVGSSGGEIRILDLGPGTVLFSAEGEAPRVRVLAITPDGKVAVWAGDETPLQRLRDAHGPSAARLRAARRLHQRPRDLCRLASPARGRHRPQGPALRDRERPLPARAGGARPGGHGGGGEPGRHARAHRQPRPHRARLGPCGRAMPGRVRRPRGARDRGRVRRSRCAHRRRGRSAAPLGSRDGPGAAPARRPCRRGDRRSCRSGRAGRRSPPASIARCGPGISRKAHRGAARCSPHPCGGWPFGRTRRCSPPAATRSTCSRCWHGCARCPRSRCAAPSPRSRRARARTSSRGGSRRPAVAGGGGHAGRASRGPGAPRDPRLRAFTRGRVAVEGPARRAPAQGLPRRMGGRNLTGHTDQVTALALAPSGRLFSSSMDGTVRAWDLQSPRRRPTCFGPTTRPWRRSRRGPTAASSPAAGTTSPARGSQAGRSRGRASPITPTTSRARPGRATSP